MPTCKVNECTRPSRALGMCTLHYQRFTTHGSPYAKKRNRACSLAINDFLHRAVTSPPPPSNCLLWPFSKCGDGYGRLFRRNRNYYVHRLVCYEVHGPPPTAKHLVLHSCHNRSCCNPAHLRWGTPAENMADAVAAGRFICDRASSAKLTRSIVLFVRASSLPAPTLAAAFGVSDSAIHNIRSGRTWSHLRDDGSLTSE